MQPAGCTFAIVNDTRAAEVIESIKKNSVKINGSFNLEP